RNRLTIAFWRLVIRSISWRSGPPLRGGSLRPLATLASLRGRFAGRSIPLAELLALGAAAARRFPPAPRYARFIARPLRRPLHFARGALGARGRRCAAVPSGPSLRSLHCAAASPAAPFRSRSSWRSGRRRSAIYYFAKV